jgi:muramoyltetrapeptide carboxypeptidase
LIPIYPLKMRLQAIQPGDIVDVVAPASACTREELKLGIKALHGLGLVPRVPKDIFAKSLLFSNSDEKRLAQFKKAIYAADSHLIWCVRGGYGALRLMPEIQKWKRPARPKILLGYSDITTLHVYLNQQWKWPTLHGPLLDRLARNALTASERKELFGVLYGKQNEVIFKNLKPLNRAARQKKVLRGPVLGGNMAVLQSGLGTVAALRPKGDIIFFEDTGERPHRVDRMLSQFAQAGWFESARAVVLGQFMLNNAKDRRGLWNDVFPRFAAATKIPVLAGMPVGHDPRAQRTLPFNTRAELHLGPQASLIVDSGIRGQ